MKIPEIDLDEHWRSRVRVLEEKMRGMVKKVRYVEDSLTGVREYLGTPLEHSEPRGPVYCYQWMSDYREYFSPAGVFPSAPYCPSCGRSQYAS